ncbi:MAG: hypothetical protein E6J90_22315 [Deltaproteobacteria bacterium]|nr:MAG: hypothetical protein E6J90_22315 [Deltaproteobacteria bacterium]
MGWATVAASRRLPGLPGVRRAVPRARPRLVKLVDFGVSKVVRAGEVQTMSGMKMGTPYYMSIEQYANAAEASDKSDVYSLAILLWQMIIGELPWGRPDPNVLYHIQRTVIPTLPPESVMPAGVAKLLLRCFSIDPDDRPTMQELAVELAAVIPATDDAPSGGAILLHIAPHFLSSSPDHASTVPRAALANPDLVAAQLWPPVSLAAAAVVPYDSRLPALSADAGNGKVVPQPQGAAPNGLPVVTSDLPDPVAVVGAPPSARTSRPAVAAASAPNAPTGRVAAALLVEARPAAASLATAPAAAEPRHVAAGSSAPVIAALPTGLISQKHIAQEPPIDLSAMPRVRSVVAAAEIDLAIAKGTPGPEPYAHSELPAVVLSTQLSIASEQAAEPSAQPKRVPEQPPVLILPRPARQNSRLRLWAIGIAVVGVFIATASFVRSWRGSPPVGRQIDEGSAHATETRSSGLIGAIDDGGIPEPQRVVATTSPGALPGGVVTVTQLDAGGVPTSDNSPTAPQALNGTTDPKDARAAAPPVNATSSSDAGRVASSRAPQDRKTLRARQAEARSTGAKTGNLHMLVTPWAVCWVDGERIDQTPCMLDDLPVGRYRVRLENSVMHKLETLTATVKPGETTTIERAW